MNGTLMVKNTFAASIAAIFMAGSANSASDKQVRADLYVMSMCPFGVQAENGLIPAVRSLGGSAELNLYFIAAEAPPMAGAEDTKPVFNSLHGQPEVDENIRQVCVMKHFPQASLDYILERNKDVKAPGWQAAAAAAGANAGEIETCASGAEGAALHARNIKAANEKKINSSPTIFIEDKTYTGGRSQRAFTLALCGALKAKGVPEPEACRKALLLPPDSLDPAAGGCDANGNPAQKAAPVSFDIRVVTDKACKACEPTLLETLKARHPAASIKELDAASPEGAELIARHRATTLPLYVLDKKVEGESDFPSLKDSYYARSAGQYVLRPSMDAYIPSVHLTRPVRPKHLDVFISPLSPFAVQAEAELAQFLARSDVKDLTFSMHFIVQESVKADEKAAAGPDGGGMRSASLKELAEVSSELTARGGAPELRESLRQVCLFQHSSIGNYFTYQACRSSNLQDESRADSCLKAGEAVDKCMKGPEGRRLLLSDAKLVKELGISTSIALLWENRYGPFGWHDVDWKGLISGK